MEPASVFGGSAQYDAQVKATLARKTFLSRILLRTVRELDGLSPEEVASRIEGSPEVGDAPVGPGLTNARVLGGGEDCVPGEGTVRYDIRTSVIAPGRDGPMRVIVNVEGQRRFDPGYRIVTRGVFYAARLISAQLGTEFGGSDYDSVKKVYSIWVCMGAPASVGNAISSYSLSKRDLLGSMPDEPATYDKAEVVIIALNERSPAGDELTGMLNLLLSPNVPAGEKAERLEDEYNMALTSDDVEGVEAMCNISGWVEECGANRKLTELVLANLKRGKKPEEFAEYLGLTVEEVREIEEEALATA